MSCIRIEFITRTVSPIDDYKTESIDASSRLVSDQIGPDQVEEQLFEFAVFGLRTCWYSFQGTQQGESKVVFCRKDHT